MTRVFIEYMFIGIIGIVITFGGPDAGLKRAPSGNNTD